MRRWIDDLWPSPGWTARRSTRPRVAMDALAPQVYETSATARPPRRRAEFRLTLCPRGRGPGAPARGVRNLFTNAVKSSSKAREARVGGRRPGGRGPGGVLRQRQRGGFRHEVTTKAFGVFKRLHTAQEFEARAFGAGIVDRIVRSTAAGYGGRESGEALRSTSASQRGRTMRERRTGR